MVDGYKELERIYKESKANGLETEVIFEKIEEFFINAGENFRNGLITEEEFYLCTNAESLVSIMLVDMGIEVISGMVNEQGNFAKSFEAWKKTGKVKPKQWMYESISPNDDIIGKVEMFFKIIDVLKFPLRSFIKLKLENKDDFPPISIGEHRDSIFLFARGHCTNISHVLADENPIGKEFILNIEFINPFNKIPYKTTARITIETKKESFISGKGIIKDFMAQEGHIEIDRKEYIDFFAFGKIKATRLQKLFRTYVLPIPVNKWLKWERERLKKAYEFEAEYKTLRLPYMIGFEEEDNKRRPQEGNIYRIY